MDTPPPLPPDIWAQTPPVAQELIVAQAAALAQLRGEVAQLRATVEALAQRLGRTSRHSSQPPSADPPQTTRLSRAPSGRRPGGQPGHKGPRRALVPIAQVDVIIPLRPERCARCQVPLQGEDGQPPRHQVPDIPSGTLRVTEYQLPRLVCPVCGAVTRAEWPVGVPRGGCGPRVQAITALCTGAYHLSRRTTPMVMADLFGIAIGLGTVANLEQATIQAWAEPVAEARTYVQAQLAAYLDETGWREGRPRAWLWTAATTGVTVFVVRRSRRAKVAHELLGERFWGSLVTDRWRADPWYPTWRRQVCWAHLLRDIEAMIERGGTSQTIGEALRAQAPQMFHWWHRVRDGTLAPPTCARDMWPVRQEVERVLDAGQTCGVPKTEGTCRAILKRRQALWTFVRHPEVEPTNHAAERAIRPGVLWRQGSVGTQSPVGSRVVETMMTAVATLTQQHRNLLAYVITACEAALHNQPAPSLLPTPAPLPQVVRPAA